MGINKWTAPYTDMFLLEKLNKTFLNLVTNIWYPHYLHDALVSLWLSQLLSSSLLTQLRNLSRTQFPWDTNQPTRFFSSLESRPLQTSFKHLQNISIWWEKPNFEALWRCRFTLDQLPMVSSSCFLMYSTIKLAICLYSSYVSFNPFLWGCGASPSGPVASAGVCSVSVRQIIYIKSGASCLHLILCMYEHVPMKQAKIRNNLCLCTDTHYAIDPKLFLVSKM